MSINSIIAESKLQIGDVPNFLNDYIGKAILSIQAKDYEEGLEYLLKSEEILEAVATQGGCVDENYVIVTLYNKALCYQK